MYPFLPAISSLQIMGAWSRLADMVCYVSDEFSGSLGLSPDLVLDAITRVLGFGSARGFAAAVRNGAMASQVCDRYIGATGEEGYRGKHQDSEYLLALAASFELGAAASALVDAPSSPLRIGRDEDWQSDTDLFSLAIDVDEALSGVREELLYAFSICNHVVSPGAFREAKILAEALLGEKPLGLRQIGLPKTLEALCKARFPLSLATDEIEALIADEDFTWAKKPSATLADLSEKFAKDDGGWASVELLRDRLKYQPSDSFDYAYDSSPSLFLALANAPSQARFNMHNKDGVPAIYLDAATPNASDIDHLLMCSGAMPRRVDVFTREEAEAIAAPHLAGWYRLHWDI